MNTVAIQSTLVDRLGQIQGDLRAGRFPNEATVSQGVVLPILHELGWPVFDTRIVAPEYALEGRRVDFALCDRTGSPTAFVEVKRVGQSDGGDRQLFEYAFMRGVPLAILTDGQEWSFYLPGEQGHVAERRVYKLDLLERTSVESTDRLVRYLKRDRVLDGSALTSARADYKDVARLRQIEVTLPRAWSALLKEEDSLLLDLLAEKVEDICGYKPDLEACSRFVASISSATLPQKVPLSTGRSVEPAPVLRIEPATQAVVKPGNGSVGFSMDGRRFAAGSAREVLQGILGAFAKKDPTFLDRFASRKHGRKRRYIAINRADLYPGRPDLAAEHAIELGAGWWMGTNYSKRSIAEIIDLACEVAEVHSADLQINLG
ncbi:MAG TPA: hypothetical protein DGD08_16675 [Gemmatimonas aurantiaca]|uniref:Type I restriction enzyme R protein N-terminal domain-containing protein n=1 Tax=Gemmatimonas aurantiaca TaxID=173480 RepID=A0A3D4VCH3_9BACT|nr:hypothetical protein [Gemmatimonas aurantiaca]HCT58836.1 hypothetical protein [Gemmatimonas aurantiaca]